MENSQSTNKKRACGVCGRELPPTEVTCPYCREKSFEKSKTTGGFIGILVFVVIIGLGISGVMWLFSGEKEKSPAVPETAEQIRQNTIKKHFSVWDGSHTGIKRAIKDSMHDPSSFEHVETTYIDAGTYLIVETTFRGKNKFGALVINKVKGTTDLNGNVLEIISTTP